MNAGRVKVLQLIKCLDHGGAERLVATAVLLGDREHFQYEVAFVRSDMRGLVDELTAHGITVHDLRATSDFDLRWLFRLRRLLLAERYAVLHAHLPYTTGLNRLVSRTLPRSRRPRLVSTEHSLFPENARAMRWLRRLTSRLDDVSIAVAESNRAALPAAIRRRTKVLIHGIDRDAARTVRDRETVRGELGIPPEHLLVVSVANLTEQKGHPILLAAARNLVDTGLPVTFVSAGAGPLESRLRLEHQRLELGDRVRWLGQRGDALDLIAASDVLVLSSRWECMPVVVMEAFAVGTPVVATATGDLPAVIEDEVNGLLVPPGDAVALAAALSRVLTDSGLRRRLAEGAARAAERFDARRTTRALETIYSELAS